MQPNFPSQWIKPCLPSHFLNVLQWPVNSPSNHPANYHRLPRHHLIPSRLIDRAERSRTRGSCEDAYPFFHLCLCWEPVTNDPADAAFLWYAEAGGAIQAERACNCRAIESQELISIGKAPRMLLWEFAGFDLNRLAILLEPGQRSLHIVNFQDSFYSTRLILRLQPACPAYDLHNFPWWISFHKLSHWKWKNIDI